MTFCMGIFDVYFYGNIYIYILMGICVVLPFLFLITDTVLTSGSILYLYLTFSHMIHPFLTLSVCKESLAVEESSGIEVTV